MCQLKRKDKNNWMLIFLNVSLNNFAIFLNELLQSDALIAYQSNEYLYIVYIYFYFIKIFWGIRKLPIELYDITSILYFDADYDFFFFKRNLDV